MLFSQNSENYSLFIKDLSNKSLINKNRDLDYWGNFPIRTNDLRGLYEIFKPGFKLLDLGSGGGQVLNFAKNIGYDVHGVEFDRDLAQNYPNTIHKDVRELSQDFYKDFDIIYKYRQ